MAQLERTCLESVVVRTAAPEPSRTKAIPLFMAITEGRGASPTYAWCGDFVTYCLSRAGVMDGTALNRAELNGSWRVGDNIARLIRWAEANGAVTARSTSISGVRELISKAEPCDVLVFAGGQGGHVGFFRSRGADGLSYNTTDGNLGPAQAAGNRLRHYSDALYWPSIVINTGRMAVGEGVLADNTVPVAPPTQPDTPFHP